MRERLSFYEREFLANLGNSDFNNNAVSLYMDENSNVSDNEGQLIGFLNHLDEKMFG